MAKQFKLVLAPIRGITDCHFRNLFHQHFPGFDSSLAPFINPQRHSLFHQKQLKDVLPESNHSLALVPQLLHTNADDFLSLANRLHELGYKHINWNLGCPAPMVTTKHRGSGLLPFPDQIISFIDQVLSKLPMALSIKTRLGYENNTELLALLPRLDDYPLTEIIIHPRLGKQLYKGETDKEAFGLCLDCSKHHLVYNGDITSVKDFRKLQQQFPTIHKWMIGRGALANPFLVGDIKEIPATDRLERLHIFHDELYACYRELLSGQSHLLGRMKQLWIYLRAWFPPEIKTWKKIKKCRTEKKYQLVIEDIFNTSTSQHTTY